MDGWVGDILTSSGSDETGSQNALCGNLLVLMNPRRVQSGWVGFIFFNQILAKVLTEYAFAGNLLILVNQGRVQGLLKVMPYQSKPGHRMPPCEESPGTDQ